jgi:hypothetical protein
MSSNTTLGAAARNRLFAFNGFVWIFGLVLITVIAVATFSDLDSAGGASDDYAYEPWLNPDPVLAEDEGDGVYSGVDGAMISLTGLDPSQPLLVGELDGTYIGDVTVTGPEGKTLAENEYGEPVDFDSYAAVDGQYVIVPQPDVELWIDGFSDERWRAKITTPALEEHEGTVSGFGPTAFVYPGDATTARVSTRGEGRVSIETVTVSGVTEVFSEREGTDRSIAWADSDLIIFVVDAWDDAGWTIEFPPAAAPATPTPSGTPAPTALPAPEATGGAP